MAKAWIILAMGIFLLPIVYGLELNDSLAAYWTMDDANTTNGTIMLDVHGSNDGILQGTAISGIPGIINEGYTFPNAGDFVNVSYDPSFDSTFFRTVTAACWFNPTTVSATSQDTILGFNIRSAVGSKAKMYGYRMYLSSNNGGTVYGETHYLGGTRNPVTNISSSVRQLTAGANVNISLLDWHHIAVTWDNSSGTEFGVTKIYFDGQLRNSTSNATSFLQYFPPLVNHTLRLANDRAGGAVTQYYGDLDECGVWARSLSASEISQLYNLGAGFPYENFSNSTNVTIPATYDCNDSIDNDGDGFIDLADPHCSGPSDNTETPYDYTQCNNGIDDDNDGYVDLADARCNDLTDTSEYPADTTTQPDNVCAVEDFCLLREQFPYTDSILLHGWEGNAGNLVVEQRLGSGQLYFDTENATGSTEVDFSPSIPIVNTNTYSDVEFWFDWWPEVGDTYPAIGVTYEYWIRLFDDTLKTAILLRAELKRTSGNTISATLYNYNGTGAEVLKQFSRLDGQSSAVRIILDIDQTLKTFRFNYVDQGQLVEGSTDYNWYEPLAIKVNRLSIENINYSSTYMDTYIDNILIFGSDISFDTVCDEWDLPYYLVENFNGYLLVCDWSCNKNIYADGELEITNITTPFVAQKNMDLVEDSATRYVTVSFDQNIIDVATGSTITLRLYDSDMYNFITIYWRDSGDELFYNADGIGTVAQTGIPLNNSYQYKLIIDFQSDTYDIYFNGTKVVTAAVFNNDLANIEDMQTIKLQSNNAHFIMDALKIYASDSAGNPEVPDDDIPLPIETTTSFCGLFYDSTPACSSDDDCESGKCMTNNRCSKFDFSYCDEHGRERGNMCFIAASTSCVLSSTGEVILDNFFLFLILLVMVMGAVYLAIMFRQR